MDEKVKIVLSPKKPKTIEFGGKEFKVYPYIGIAQKSILISNYVNAYFGIDVEQNNYLVAEGSLMHEIIEQCTNLDIGSGENFDLDAPLTSGLYDIIVKNIINFEEFKNDLNKVVEIVEAQRALEKSVGAAFTNVADKILSLLAKLESIDVSQEGIKKLSEQLLEQKKSFEDSWGKMESVPTPGKKVSRKAKIEVTDKDKGLLQ